MNNNGKASAFDDLIAFLNKLESRHITYELAHHRDEALMISVVLPGQRWEIEFLLDGSVEIEKFVSDGHIYDETVLVELFEIDSGLLTNAIEDDALVAFQR
jgi:hypothetical protein